MQYEDFEMKIETEEKSDLIGWMYGSDLFHVLGVDRSMTKGECEKWSDFEETLRNAIGNAPVEIRNDVEDRAQYFGNAREETGFRIGFHVAMRLCMEGLNGGVR